MLHGRSWCLSLTGSLLLLGCGDTPGAARPLAGARADSGVGGGGAGGTLPPGTGTAGAGGSVDRGTDSSGNTGTSSLDAVFVHDAGEGDGSSGAADVPGSVAPDPARVSDAASAPLEPITTAPAALVSGLSLDRFKDNIKKLAAFGDRTQGSPSFVSAGAWLDQQLTALGYTVAHHQYVFAGGSRTNTFATKLGTKFPDRMYLVSAHLDGRGNGGAADDNGSGCSLVLEAARAFARAGVETEVSIRFAFWDNEETGFDGARAYIRDRGPLQGVEEPPGSRQFPEPHWLGILQHDMILYDHGLPPGPTQVPNADINVDFQASSKQAALSKELAGKVAAAGKAHAKDYPISVGSNMAGTDSVAFQELIPSVSVREARREEEILRGSNPNHHKPTDVFESYSDADFRLGFNALETTVGTVAALVGTRIAGAP